ncbi:hypothetical protein [Sphingomonas hankookensis]
MSDPVSKPVSGTTSERAADAPQPPVYLNSEPDHFFSNRFRTRVVESDPTNRRDGDHGLIWMIATIGVPILAYCIFSAM